MSIRKKLLPTFNSIKTGKTATCDLYLGQRYHSAWLELSDDGTASAGNDTDVNATLDNLLGDIRVKINGKPQRTHTGAELNQINSVNGAAFTAKTSGTAGDAGYRVYLPIFFAEPWRKSNAQVSAAAWDIAGPGVNSFQIEVDLKAGLVDPNVAGFYEWEPATKGLGMISKVMRHDFGAIGTQQDFSTLDRKDYLQAIHLLPTVETTPKFVQYLKMTANGVEIQDLLSTLQNQAILLGRELNPDTSAVPRFDLVQDYDDPIGSALLLDGLSEFTLHVEYNAAASGTLRALILRAGSAE